jgi:hypothetical protein
MAKSLIYYYFFTDNTQELLKVLFDFPIALAQQQRRAPLGCHHRVPTPLLLPLSVGTADKN